MDNFWNIVYRNLELTQKDWKLHTWNLKTVAEKNRFWITAVSSLYESTLIWSMLAHVLPPIERHSLSYWLINLTCDFRFDASCWLSVVELNAGSVSTTSNITTSAADINVELTSSIYVGGLDPASNSVRYHSSYACLQSDPKSTPWSLCRNCVKCRMVFKILSLTNLAAKLQ